MNPGAIGMDHASPRLGTSSASWGRVAGGCHWSRTTRQQFHRDALPGGEPAAERVYVRLDAANPGRRQLVDLQDPHHGPASGSHMSHTCHNARGKIYGTRTPPLHNPFKKQPNGILFRCGPLASPVDDAL